MAMLRQLGCPTLFLTLSCAEYDWLTLLKEIVETVERRKVSQDYIENLPAKEKNRLISENVVITTLHFQKRIDKLFALMKHDFFVGPYKTYHVSTYYYRVEFQQRGSPHIHALVWLKDQDDKDAPNFWVNCDDKEEVNIDEIQRRLNKVEEFADQIVSTSPELMRCENHNTSDDENSNSCTECKYLQEKVKHFQCHSHTFTCEKKKKFITIKENEGHGRLDGKSKGPELRNIPVCRFHFPKWPMNETKVVLQVSKEIEDEELKKRKTDLCKVRKFLLRQTFKENGIIQEDKMNTLKSLSFWEFLYEAGMFESCKEFNEHTSLEKDNAKVRYLNALSVSVQGKACVVLKRSVKDIFINGYNGLIMRLQNANHDIQIVIDPFTAGQYVCGYMTKNEAGQSRFLQAVNEEMKGIKAMEKLNALASVLDKSREVSIQEAVYRILGLPMTKSSIVVKYISTVHPNFRDGLLKSNLEEIEESDSVFHNSPVDYYESRPEKSDQPNIIYNEAELVPDYWNDITFSEFWSQYEIVYKNQVEVSKEKNKKKQKLYHLKMGVISVVD